ncbi:MAG: efflux RND transporter periplasmic adaptor subunit [Deltaproteobacteria bacterium]|nr:efflux RND transporter periplasmic adaptor subunit [Deltaproteobacteria bacterium]
MTSAPTTLRIGVPLLALLAAAGCHRGDAAAAKDAPPAIVLGAENVARVEAKLLQSGPAISGALRARREATLRAEVGGALLDNSADPGTAVKKGQLLARIEDGALSDQLRAAEQAVRAADNALAFARRDLLRSRQLSEGGALPAQGLERAETVVAQQEALLADAQARLAAAQLLHGRTRLRAPFDGVVSDRQARAGDVVQPGTPLFTVVDPTSMRLEAAVPAEGLALIRPGTPVHFTVTGYGARAFSGAIEQVNPVVDPATGQVRIAVTVPNAGGELLAGLFARGRVATESRTAPAVVADAIDPSTTPPSVLRVKDGKVERVPVVLGARDEVADRIEVKSGLLPGDAVLRGSARAGIAEGTAVQLTTTTADVR